MASICIIFSYSFRQLIDTSNLLNILLLSVRYKTIVKVTTMAEWLAEMSGAAIYRIENMSIIRTPMLSIVLKTYRPIY